MDPLLWDDMLVWADILFLGFPQHIISIFAERLTWGFSYYLHNDSSCSLKVNVWDSVGQS